MKEKFNFFAVVNGRMRRLLEKIGLPDATKGVNFAHETLADLTAGRLVRAGVRGIWNFTNSELTVEAPDVVVEDVHFADSLLALSYMISEET